jgi:hypothetical protein
MSQIGLGPGQIFRQLFLSYTQRQASSPQQGSSAALQPDRDAHHGRTDIGLVFAMRREVATKTRYAMVP